jgi:mRNA interferase MazF
MMRGDVYDARLNPTEGLEQAGVRPVVIVSRNAINQYSPVIVVVPFTDAANLKRTYPSDVLVRQPEGGLTVDSVALTGQVRAIAKTRLLKRRGALSSQTLALVAQALRVTMDL